MKSETGKIDPAKSMVRAAQAVAHAKVLLTTASVEGLDYCETELATAIESLQNLRQSLEAAAAPAASGMRDAVLTIRRDVSEFAGLLRQATEFQAGWSALAESGSAGYNAAGAPARIDRDPSRIALKG
jgi:hypothetical protein